MGGGGGGDMCVLAGGARCGPGGISTSSSTGTVEGRRRGRSNRGPAAVVAAVTVVHGGEHVNLFVLFVEQVLELADLALELADALLERLGVAARKGAAAELVAGAALEADVCALRACRAGAVAANLFAAAPVAGLSDAALGAGADLDDLHGEYAGHLDGAGGRALPLGESAVSGVGVCLVALLRGKRRQWCISPGVKVESVLFRRCYEFKTMRRAVGCGGRG